MADRVGNAIQGAINLNLLNGATSFSDRLSASDRNDFFRVRLNQRSSVTIALRGLRANADVALLNGQGRVIQRGTRRGTQAEQLQRTLAPGNYYVRVFQNGKSNTPYRLTLNANPITLPSSVDPNANRSRFNIEFDYRYDTKGWFTAERRRALESAARIWENLIQDDFPDLATGTRTGSFRNPQTGETITGYKTDTAIDDLKIFVGARSLSGFSSTTLARSAPSGWFLDQSRYTSAKFEPWIGTMAFDTGSNWFFDATPTTANDLPRQRIDFISVAAHEIGHILGIGLSDAFLKLADGTSFNGTNARAVNGNNPVPLSSDRGHIAADFQPQNIGDSLMTPFFTEGTRKLPTVIDLAMLNDIGYSVNYNLASRNAVRPSFNVPNPGNDRATLVGNRSAGNSGNSGNSRNRNSRNRNSRNRNSRNQRRDRRRVISCGCSSCLTANARI